MRVTILGCGTSGGVPRIGNNWGQCDPLESKNRRRRCSILVAEGPTRLLVDTSPDLREQLLSAGIANVDAVLWTHDHADQTHGIDDLRVMAIALRRRVECYADPRTVMSLKKRFGYCFEQPPGSAYPAILNLHRLTAPMRVGSIDVTPFQQDHGETFSLGFRFGPIGYSNDASALSDTAFAALAGVKVWIVDAMRREPHPSHAHLDLTLSWIARLRPQRAILTNMHNTMDYATLRRDLPSDIEPAYDGMVIEA